MVHTLEGLEHPDVTRDNLMLGLSPGAGRSGLDEGGRKKIQECIWQA